MICGARQKEGGSRVSNRIKIKIKIKIKINLKNEIKIRVRLGEMVRRLLLFARSLPRSRVPT